MVSLSRSVRFSLPPPGCPFPANEPRHNPYGGWPSARGIAVVGALDVEVSGEPDPRSGYLINIVDIDHAVRRSGLPFLAECLDRQAARRAPLEPADLLPELARRIGNGLPLPVRRVTWRVTQFHWVSYEPVPERSTPRPAPIAMTEHASPLDVRPDDAVELAQSFDFSASHRLHSPELDDETNRRLFGKCNNPNGHGHNYRLEVVMRIALAARQRPSLQDLERIVDSTVVQRFDHRHLNSDCPEFRTVNPSVEHIAKICFDLLTPPIAAAGGELRRVTVWETEKTSCTYPARDSR